VEARPLPQGFGAEVVGFDAQSERSEFAVAAMQSAFANYNFLVLRGCGLLTPERQAEIVGWFGTLGADTGPEGEVWTTMDNAMDRGRARLPFHCDITFFRYPLEGISLHPVQLPSVDTSTTYVSNALAWDTLPADLKNDLRSRKGRHYYEDDGKMGENLPLFEYWHPVCLPHYRTGRPLLFVTEHHVEEIEGYSRDESAALLKRVFAHLYAPAHQYEHVWREGDLVIWDNYAMQHARMKEADPLHGPRVLQRVSFGEHGFSDQMEELISRKATVSADSSAIAAQQ
jgi:taurine dioxygenase